MRTRTQQQLYFKPQSPEIEFSLELAETNRILEELPEYQELLDRVLEDLGVSKDSQKRGRPGMTAEQVLRSLLVKSRLQVSYRSLSRLTKDSLSVREFLKIDPFGKGLNYKVLQNNIKMISESTVVYLHESLKKQALTTGFEDGLQIRTDATTTESNIHHPTDSSLLHDCIRVLSRCMTYLNERHLVALDFCNHYRSSKNKLFVINNTRSGSKKNRKCYLELIRLCRRTIKYSKDSLPVIEEHLRVGYIDDLVGFLALKCELERTVVLAETVLDVAHRRVVNGEKVSSSDKIVSIFEPHTDIIVKGGRNVVFGHKTTLTTGQSGLILDVMVHEGNPADSTILPAALDRHKAFYGTAPETAAFDGCYYSKDNYELLEDEGVKNICFSKGKGANQSRLKKYLRGFRAGIEATVSTLKRMFGWTRIFDKGKESFVKAIKIGAVAFNLFLLSRQKLAPA
jgi:IS5 family transposase